MRTIEQIQEKLYLMQEKRISIEKKTDQYHYDLMFLHADVRLIQSQIDTLLHDLAYDYQVDDFVSRRA